jgi:uncharacterized repeat protein (TIGR03803 family)
MTWKTLAISTFAAALAAACTVAQPASASTMNTLYSFCSLGGCQDGTQPSGSLVADPRGNLFGVTFYGGNPNNAGVVYEIVRHPRRGTSHYRVLHEFCAVAACEDGSHPTGRLVLDVAGRLFGVTAGGGSANAGVAFRVAPETGRSKWSYTTLWSFCSRQPNCSDGAVPAGGLTYAGAYAGALYDGSSPLYGVTGSGGKTGYGTAYKLQPDGGLKTLYAFCPDVGICAGGSKPQNTMVLDGAGNLYGIAGLGGSQNSGVVFELSGVKQTSESVLHDFCSLANCADGTAPTDLALDTAGNLFGTADGGGNVNSNRCPTGCGTLFKIAPDNTYSVLYAFCAHRFCRDGMQPIGITLTPSGDIYGVTVSGGRLDVGTLFRMAATLHTLSSFCCASGAYPLSAPVQDGAGRLFGTTTYPGGTVYEFAR